MIGQLRREALWNWLLLTAVVGDFAVPYILALFYKGYSHSFMVMSSLGNPSSPVRNYYNVWLIVLGLLLFCAYPVLFARYAAISKVLTLAAVILIALFAVGAGILAGIFSVNESKELVTSASKIHGLGSALGFMALLLVPLLLSILSYKANDRLAGTLFFVSFVLAFAFFVCFVMSDKPQFRDTILQYEGLWQRLSLLMMYFPLGYIALKNILFPAPTA